MSALLGPEAVHPMLAVWAVVMIAVPIVAAFGKRGRIWGISLGVLAQVAVVVTVLGQSWNWREVVAVAIAVPGLGWFAEFAGSRTGIPFGRYHYTEALQPQIHRVPVVIPLAWLMMLPPSWAVAQVLAPDAGILIRAVIAGYAFMAWDVYLDPHLTKWGFWSWDQSGSFEGIPVVNFFGWFLWATVISAISLGVLAPLPVVAGPLVVVYTITWLLQAGGHFVFWRWPISGVGGFVLMGVVAVPAVWLLVW
ncbi:MAG TPA: carotenoid biosynthesis protein [Alkalispirochaeta sp.]|nr:carotenoid biosynthesis protein [Alkalispirochaeta sp.]